MFLRFQQAFSVFPVVSLADIRLHFPGFDSRNLVHWQKKGYLIRLRNGFYRFSDHQVSEYHLYQVANRMYNPSYISLETALSYHGVIPEGVVDVQSVGTRKTARFRNKLGRFSYRTIKPSLYFGYCLFQQDEQAAVRMAYLEKAILDFLYLRADVDDYAAFEALRWNRTELERIDRDKLQAYAGLFRSATLFRKLKWL